MFSLTLIENWFTLKKKIKYGFSLSSEILKLVLVSLKLLIQRLLYTTDETPNPIQLHKGKFVLKDQRKLIQCGITAATMLESRKPYIGVTVANNYGNRIYWHLDRKDMIREVKVKLASTPHSSMASPERTFSLDSLGGSLEGNLQNPHPKDFTLGSSVNEKGVRPITLYDHGSHYSGTVAGGYPTSGSMSTESTRLYLIMDHQVFEEDH